MTRTTRTLNVERLAEIYDDSLDDSSSRYVAFGENSVGAIGYDELGQPRWKWMTEMEEGSSRSTGEGTFSYLKALSNDALELADEPGATPAKSASGVNPYDTPCDSDRLGPKRKRRGR